MNQDISVWLKHKPKKLSTGQQSKLISLFHNLFTSGFHLVEILSFLKRSKLLSEKHLSQLEQGLAEGKSLAQLLSVIGFSDTVVTQLSLADIHGNTTLSLEKIKSYLENVATIRKKLVEVATYPLLLLAFLILIMLGLKNYLLPQLENQTTATWVIDYSPQIFLGLCIFLGISGLLGYYVYQKSSKMTWYSRLSRVPFLKELIQSYLTAYYAREWGNMLGQGMELGTILGLMQEQSSDLFREIGQDLEQGLQMGQTFPQQISAYPFFKPELSLIIEYGEVKSKLGSELEVYAEKTWEEFFYRVNRWMGLIQPLVFLFVALMIVLLYAAMLLPIYQSMEVL